MAGSWATSCLAFWIGIVLCWTYAYGENGNKLCASLPELYWANVAGRISGGVDILKVSDQTLCSQRTYVDLRYRQIDGRCNHPQDYGSTFKPVKRYLRAHYQDKFGYNTPRIFSVVNGYLPSPRDVSRNVHPEKPNTDEHTMWLMQLGQTIDHDITAFPVPTESNSSIKCCGKRSPELDDVCFPIPIPPDDDVFDVCMEFVRSEAVHDNDGKTIYPREQMNAMTSFVDGSIIYGNDEETMRRLRTLGGFGALLKTRLVNGRERLPLDEEGMSPMCLVTHQHDSYCQLSGDKRVNEQPGLGSAHLTLHLFHNYIVRSLVAGILRKRGERDTPENVDFYIANAPPYIQEKLFQEARKIFGGIFQKIVFCEWLPIIVGPDLITKFQLGCDRRSRYNPYVDPRIANGFSTAAYRFGHTLIPNKIKINRRKEDLKDLFMIPDTTLNHYESIVDGMLERGSEETFDRFMSKAVTNHLFEPVFGPSGALDLVSLNIQRGRDHGLPGYYYWRRYYGLKRYTSFTDFENGSRELSKMYKHILDVDLFPGALCENPVPGGVVGETFGHIIANQFADLKYGDAHFFLSKEVPQGFTSDQIQAIMHVTMSKVICSVGATETVQENAFYAPSFTNPPRHCSRYPDFNVEPWLIYF